MKAAILDEIGDVAADRFDALSLALWRWQLDRMPLYRRFCAGRGASPRDVRSWRDIPPLPVDAFRLAELSCEPEVRRFTTSGTTSGNPGVSLFGADALTIMDAAIVENARRSLFGDRRYLILVLAPPPERAPHMIMAYGMRRIVDAFGIEGSGFLVGERGIDFAMLGAALAHARDHGVPVCLIGASFGFVNILDTHSGTTLRLPPGSRLMDAGGYKGRSRELTPVGFRALVGDAFGLADHAIINLLGMTELASQIYDVVDDVARRKCPPPWMRTRVVDPEDPLVDVGDGQLGVLAHYDLASYSRPLAILSDDLGRRRGDGFEIVGRVRASVARGCSIKVDELLAGAA